MDFPKSFATKKFERRLQSKRSKITKERISLNSEYDALVKEIEYLRAAKKTHLLPKKLEKLESIKKAKKRYKKIAVAMGGREPEVIHEYGVPLLDSLHTIIKSAQTMRDSIDENLMSLFLDLFTTLYNVYKNPTWDGVLINFSSFFLRNFKGDYADLAFNWFKQAFGVVLPQGEGEKDFSYKDYILSFFQMTDSFFNDAVWDKVSEFFSKIMSLYAAAKDLVAIENLNFSEVSARFNTFRKALPDVTDVIELAFEAYRFVAGNWKQICTGDWSNLMLGKDESKVFELEVRELEQAYNFVLGNQETELKTIYNTTPGKYEERLTKAVKTAKSLIVRATSVQQRMAISNFIRKLTEMQSNLWARKADAPVKEEAYAIKMFGPSSCGKSTMIKLLSKTILNAYGRDPNEGGSVVFTNIDERYESTILPSHRIIVADDVANNKNSKPNYDRMLNYVNTVPRPLEKASAEDKGKYYPGNDALLATTNVDCLRALECSACAESILRRFALHVEVAIRDGFRNDFGGLIKQDNLRFDVYELVLKRFKCISGGVIEWDVIPRREWNPHDDKDHDFHALCAFVAKDIEQHRKRQKSQMTMQNELDECGFCSQCRCPTVVCSCVKENEEAVAMSGFITMWQSMSTRDLWDIRALLNKPTMILDQSVRKSMLWYKIYKDRDTYFKIISLIFGSALFGCFTGFDIFKVAVVAFSLYGLFCYNKTVKEIDRELSRRSDFLSSLCEDTKQHLESNAKKYFAVSGSIFMAYAVYKVLKPLIKSQDKSSYFKEVSNYFGKVVEAPAEGKNVFETQDIRDYKEGYSRLPPKDSAVSKTTTSKDLQLSVARSLRSVITLSKGKRYGTVNGIMVASNVIMVPSHIIPNTFPFDIETDPTPGVPGSKTKDQKLTEEYCYIDRERDVAFIHLASSPASKSYVDFYPLEYPSYYSRTTVMLWKSHYNEVKISKQAARPIAEPLVYHGYLEKPGMLWGQKHVPIQYKLETGKGLTYDTEFKGFGGLCGAPIIDAERGIIYGFHVAGYHGSTKGFSTCILQSDIKKGLEKLKLTSPTLVVHSTGDVNVDTYGQPFSIINQKPLYLREDGTKDKTIVTYLGTVLKNGQPMEDRSRPPYMRTPFLGIAENLGECKHRPPKEPNAVEKAMKTLNKLTDPVQHYEGDILSKAIADYAKHTLDAFTKDPEFSDIMRIYSQEEAMNGSTERGLGGLPSSTSAGFPLFKSKKHCLVRDPMDEAQVKVPREFNDNYDIQEQIDYTIDCWKNGKRSEAIYKTSSKVNELLPTKKANEKVRKFYGSQFANFVASRRALAGIPIIMRKLWRTSECMVGINATSKEWDDFHTYLTEYSKTRMIAGDFAGFDTRMAAQITGAAAKIMVSWYEAAGCSEEDLALVRGALSDIIHPNILFEGDLYRFANGNPSGNLITVQLNSICNSIMMRYVYYAQYPKIREPFASNVRLGTYGDDNAMSVKHHCSWYTHTSCQKEFEKLDISYTMADKDAESRPYIGIEEISFLKRSFKYDETLNRVVAPIEEDSILKRFHWIKKPSETPLSFTEQFGAYSDGAMREYYLFGRESYEAFQQKLRNIVALNDDLRGVINFIPYEEMTAILKPYYSKDYSPKNDKLFAESMDVSLEDLKCGDV